MDERRANDTRIALLEQSHTTIAEALHRIEGKLDTYNQYRERLDNACKSIDEHKKGHTTMATMTISGSVLGVAALTLILHVLRVI